MKAQKAFERPYKAIQKESGGSRKGTLGCYTTWQCIDIQGMKQAWGGHWNLGILRGDSGGDTRAYWGLGPQYWLIGPPESPFKIPRFRYPWPVSYP